MNTLIRIEKKAYIFDLFHTLTDRESVWANLPTTSEYLGIDRDIWNEFLQFGSYERLCGFERDEFKIIRDIVDKIDNSISDTKVREAIEIRKNRFGQALVKIPSNTIETLAILKSKGIKLGLLSNADVMEIAMWNQSPIASIFDSTIFSCNVGYAKPDAEIYRLSMNELSVSANEAIFIGDGGSDELRGAKQVGLSTIMITGVIQELWPEKIDQRRIWADYEIERIEQLQ
ncbi:MAG: HAD-IA family hydrolase [Candidatus Kapaibacterium sp.]|nr:HAD-IA family hydrolase [Bacteroidota bacterium]